MSFYTVAIVGHMKLLIETYPKGGTAITTENVQLLCARHNLEKSAKIE